MLAVLLVLFAVWAAIVLAVVALCASARRTDAEIALDDAVAWPREAADRATPDGRSRPVRTG